MSIGDGRNPISAKFMLEDHTFEVLDFTHVQYGPTCTRLLAGFRADVIRIERPGASNWSMFRVPKPAFHHAEPGVLDNARVALNGIASCGMSISDEGLTARYIGGHILLKRFEPDGSSRQHLSKRFNATGLSIGDTLGEQNS